MIFTYLTSKTMIKEDKKCSTTTKIIILKENKSNIVFPINH